MCRLHPTYPITFFCQDEGCGVTICAMCVAKDHTSHTFIDLAEAHGPVTAGLHAAVDAVMLPLAAAAAGKVAVQGQIVLVKANCEKALQTIDSTFRPVAVAVTARKNVLKEEVQAESQRKIDALVAQRTELERVHDRLENGVEVAERMQGGARPTELLQASKLLRVGLAAAADHKVAVAPVCGPSVVLVGSAEIDALVATIGTLGGVSGGDTNAELCSAEGVATKVVAG
jgi:hypothetical protein